MRVREYNVNENKVGLSIEDGINLASAQFKEDAYEIYKESRKTTYIICKTKLKSVKNGSLLDMKMLCHF